MLISHSRRFIYLKTRKSGSTSVETYFEPWCIDPAKQPEGDTRDAECTRWGVVGSRGDTDDPVWYNHLPASRIRELIGEEKWRRYYKFCVVRNPFDKVVSYFWFNVTEPLRAVLGNADFSVVRKSFSEWMQETEMLPFDRFVYLIDGKPAVNDFIRYERLPAGMARVCTRLEIPWEPERLTRYKSGFRIRTEHFSEYYTADAEEKLRSAFAWELEYFGYACASEPSAGLRSPA